MDKNKRFIILDIILIILLGLSAGHMISYIVNVQKQPEYVSYKDFLVMCEEGKVNSVTYNSNSEEMEFTLFTEETLNMSQEERNEHTYSLEERRRTNYPAYEDFQKDMLELGVTTYKTKSVLSFIFDNFSWVLIFLWIIVLGKTLSGTMGISLTEDNLLQESNVKFKDIIGMNEILEDVKFIVELIKNPEKGKKIGVSLPKGVLLSGPPGTGKTLLAKAIAGEADVPFLYMNASNFIEMYAGVGAKRVRELFKIAQKHSPCIVFIDEIDAVGGEREYNKNSSENNQTINALLQALDGFTERDGIFVIAATNRPEKLDKALVRANRFDREIKINPPKNAKVRTELFDFYLKKFKVSEDVDIDSLGQQTSGFTGADISTLCNEAGIIAMMDGKEMIDAKAMEEAIDKIIFKGNHSKREQYIEDKQIVAYHEAGHAVASYVLKEPIARASIQETTSGVGGAVFHKDKESSFVTNQELIHHIMIAYAGRVSEEIKFHKATTGASNDITQATNIMLNYIEKYGFDKDFGLLDMGVLRNQNMIESEAITDRLSKMSKNLYGQCENIMEENFDKVEILAEALLEKETLSECEIIELLS